VVAASATSTDQALYRVPLAGGAAALIAGGPAVHSATASDDGSVLVDREERLEAPARHQVLRSADGEVLGQLPSQAEPFVELPHVELTEVTTPHGVLQAAIVRPIDFSPRRHYPVIDWVYGGPTAVTVQRSAASYTLQQWVADQGFVVVKIDNRGTPWRGREFERVTKGSFAEIALGDQADALTQLARSARYLDLDRLGIIGASFGGYLSALAVLRRPGLFKAAVAIAPVVAWEDYDTHYTERYLGTPAENPDGYHKSSLLTGAAQLARPLLLIHGTADDNVHFGGTLKLIQSLEAAGKGASLFLVPGQTHMFADQPTQRLMWATSVAFLAEHLQ
jgi:dipeptidyl-peptidase-4